MKTDARGRLIIPMTLVLCDETGTHSSAHCSQCGEFMDDGRDLYSLVMIHPPDYPAEFHRWLDLHLCKGCRKELLEVAREAEQRREDEAEEQSDA